MTRLALLAALLPFFLCVPAYAQTTAYVVNEGAGTVSIIETQTEKVKATIDIGERPRGLAVTKDGERFYVSRADGTVVERDMFSRVESARIKLDRQPASLDVSPDAKVLAAVMPSEFEIALVDLATMRVARKIPIPGGERPTSAVFSPDGRWIYATVEQSPDIRVIDVRQGAVTNTIRVGPQLRGLAFLPDGSRAYVATDQPAELVVIDVARHAVLARVKTTSPAVAVTHQPDGKRIFVSTATGKVEVVDASTHQAVAEFESCDSPSSMAFTPDGQKLYVTCTQASQVSVIDAATFKRLTQISVGARPVNIVVRDSNAELDPPDWLPRPGKSTAP